MYIVLNIIHVKAGHLAEFLDGVCIHARHSASEPGCVRYEVMQDVNNPQIVCLNEVFQDEAAFREHLTHDYYKHWMSISRDWRHSEDRIRHVLDYACEDGTRLPPV